MPGVIIPENDEGGAVVEEAAPGLSGPSRDELIASLEGIDIEGAPEAAADKAAPAASTGETKAAPVANAKAKAAEPAAEAAETEEEPRIATLLKAREKAQKTREEAESEAAQIRAQAKREAAEEGERIRADARRKAEEEQEQLRRAYRESPLEAFKRMGVDGQKLVDDVTKEGTPEWRRLQAAEQRAEALEKKLAAIDEWKASQEQREQARAAYEGQEQARRQQDTFMRNHASAEKAPSAYKIWEPQEILAKAISLDGEIRQMKPSDVDDPRLRELIELSRTNLVAYWDELGQHLEYTAKRRLAKLGQEQDLTSSGAKPAAATKAKGANGSRTPSASSSSERRASLRPASDLSPEELRAELVELAEAEIKAPRK